MTIDMMPAFSVTLLLVERPVGTCRVLLRAPFFGAVRCSISLGRDGCDAELVAKVGPSEVSA